MFICEIFQPLMVKNWELHVHFKVHGSGKNLFGDGFAVWYARDRNQLGKYDLRWNFLDKKTEFIRITFAHTVKYFF